MQYCLDVRKVSQMLTNTTKQKPKQNQPPGNLPICAFYPGDFVIHK